MLRGNLVFAVVLGSLTGSLHAASLDFDKPIRTQSVAPEAVPGRGQLLLTCLYFPHFMVMRQRYDNRDVGDYSIEPANARCAEPKRGLFASLFFGRLTGVKGRYVLLEHRYAAQYPAKIAVLDGGTGREIFEDDMSGTWSAVQFTADGFSLRYRRTFTSDCALLYGLATECWTRIKRATGLTDAMAPDCQAAYDKAKKLFAGEMKYVLRTSAKITYAVETRYAGGKLTYTAKPGDVTCAT